MIEKNSQYTEYYIRKEGKKLVSTDCILLKLSLKTGIEDESDYFVKGKGLKIKANTKNVVYESYINAYKTELYVLIDRKQTALEGAKELKIEINTTNKLWMKTIPLS